MAAQTRTSNDTLLRRALRGNGLFSAFSGLLGFAGGLFLNTMRDEIDRVQAALAIAMDIGWVVFSAIVLITGALPFSTAGGWAVLIVADGVTVFAILQVVGLRRMGER
jgi:uncharacterized membrane protein YbjE (DUF340 family)